jgi:hypothetical protein
MTQQWVIDELCMTWLRKRLTQQTALVFHSDGPTPATRRSKYASQAFRKALKDYGMVQSMNGHRQLLCSCADGKVLAFAESAGSEWLRLAM